MDLSKQGYRVTYNAERIICEDEDAINPLLFAFCDLLMGENDRRWFEKAVKKGPVYAISFS